jgi:hypothetical protein
LNYSTRIVFKSSKVVPTMILGTVLQGRRYSWSEYAAAALLVAGVSLFCLGDVEVAPNFHIAGVGLITLALFADAATSNFEEKRFFRVPNPVSQAEVIFCSSALSTAAGFAVLLPTRELGPAWRHSRANSAVVPLLSMAAVCGYLRHGGDTRARACALHPPLTRASCTLHPPLTRASCTLPRLAPQRHVRAAAHQVLRRHKHGDCEVAAQGAVHRALLRHIPKARQRKVPGGHGGHRRQPADQLPPQAHQDCGIVRARAGGCLTTALLLRNNQIKRARSGPPAAAFRITVEASVQHREQ